MNMTCSACGAELDPHGNCSRCAPPASPVAPSYFSDDPFALAAAEVTHKRGREALFVAFALIFTALVLFLNYLRALRWAGLMNAESIGYMIGGLFLAFALGLLVMYVVQRIRGKKIPPALKALGITSVALLFSLFGLAREIGIQHALQADAYRQMRTLLKEAAGKQPRSKDANWWDAPTRDLFQDLLEMNQHYTADAVALDKSAIRDLYSSKSYGGEVHMQKVVTQLRAVQAVDERYASLDPLIKKMQVRVEAADAPESAKQDFLKGMRESLEARLTQRGELVRKEEAWIKSTISLYEFAIAH